ncbi:peptidoglycan DD-metalloendopeptidase family protein [bacterium]|nr:peptidoglycan DD-metalloendopeptidase family protein [bacterium]
MRLSVCEFLLTFFIISLTLSCVLSQPAVPQSSKVPEVIRAAQKKYGLPDYTPKAPIVPEKMIGLKELVEMERNYCSWACITSTFYDYRTVSKYRRNPGFHLGYDIAMEAGSPVCVGWSGTVVSIAPWYDNEWGVTVASPNGMEVTYGHIVPSVSVGKTLQSGDIVGRISVNHVDVKMRDANGNYVPFGEKDKELILSSGTPVVSETPKEKLLVAWLTARNTREVIEDELNARRRESEFNNIERQRLEERFTSQKLSLRKMEEFFQEGLVSRKEVEKTRANFDATKKALSKVKDKQLKAPKKEGELLEKLQRSQERESKAQKEAEKRGLSWQDVQNFVNQLVLQDSNLNKAVKDYKRERNEEYQFNLIRLKNEIKSCQLTLESQKKLYKMGGLPQRDLEATEKRLQILEDELLKIQIKN